MADILILGMEMPKNEPLRLVLNPNGQLFVDHGVTFTEYEAVELPEHGNLVSRDEAVSVLQNLGSRDYRREKGTICDAIKMISHEQYVPTIVPSNKEV